MRRRPIRAVAHKGESIAAPAADFQAGIAHTRRVPPAELPDPPPWVADLPLKPGPPWLSMGVRPLDLSDWLVLDDRSDAELALKDQLLRDRHHEVFAAVPGTEAAGAEVLELVGAWLATHAHPEPAGPDGSRQPSGGTRSGGQQELHPLDRAGRLVQEDLCLLGSADGHYVLEAASLCFPSHWVLAEKLGRSVAAIHAPVPHYSAELESRVDTFMARLRADRPVMRRNLSIHSHDDLFRPDPHESPASFAPDVSGLDQVWLRRERQTLVRLPATGAVLFTIKTQQCPVRALARRPEVARALAVKLRALEPELAATGETVPFPPWLIPWLLDPT